VLIPDPEVTVKGLSRQIEMGQQCYDWEDVTKLLTKVTSA
jgi:hypothetical protein